MQIKNTVCVVFSAISILIDVRLPQIAKTSKGNHSHRFRMKCKIFIFAYFNKVLQVLTDMASICTTDFHTKGVVGGSGVS